MKFHSDDLYPDGPTAAAVAMELSVKVGTKFQPRRITDSGVKNWRNTLIIAFDKRNHNQVDELRYVVKQEHLKSNTEKSTISVPSIEPMKYHFLRHATKEEMPAGVAYIASEEDGAHFRWTVTRFGRYLAEFYNKHLDANRIRDMATQFEAVHSPADFNIATSAEEMEWVFRNANFGCASQPHWPKDKTHPALIYNSPDIGVAFLKRKDNSLSARCIVVPERKVFTGGYGDSVRLTQALIAAGFTQSKSNFHNPADDMLGLRVRKIPDGKGGYVGAHMDYMPYVKDYNDEYFITCKSDEATWGFTSGDPHGVRMRGK